MADKQKSHKLQTRTVFMSGEVGGGGERTTHKSWQPNNKNWNKNKTKTNHLLVLKNGGNPLSVSNSCRTLKMADI